MTKPAKWSLGKAAFIGVLVGIVYTLARPYIFGETPPTNLSFVAGSVLGGAIGGAALASIIAMIRNSFVK
ncbi:MAG: hypothetical protein AAFP99_06515 [Pseudomonadota bacterium]